MSVFQNDYTDNVKIYYNELKKCVPLDANAERELLIKSKSGDISARNKIVESNLRFVFDIARRFRGRGVSMSDLISEGNIGLMKAIERFDMSRDVKFFSYAVWWIRQHMMKEIVSQRERETNESGFDDVFRDNAHPDNVCPDDDIEENDASLNGISDNNVDFYEVQQKHFVVEKLLAKLDDRERIIISKYFGIEDDSDGHNINEIGKELNLSSERVRQLKIKAINTMRAEVFDMKEADFLFR